MNTLRIAIIIVLVSVLLRARVSSTEVVQITKSLKNFDYAFFGVPKLTWLGALQYCSERRGYLVDITSKEEMNFVLKLQQQADLLKYQNFSGPAWTGGNAIDNEVREFKWIKTGKSVDKTYFSKEGMQAKQQHNCLAFRPDKRFKLHSFVCGLKRAFICKIKQ